MDRTLRSRFECKYWIDSDRMVAIRKEIRPFMRPDRFAGEHAKCLDVGCMWKHVEHTDLPQLKAVFDQNRRVAGKRDRVTGYIDDSLQRR